MGTEESLSGQRSKGQKLEEPSRDYSSGRVCMKMRQRKRTGGQERCLCFKMTDSNLYADGKDERFIPSFPDKRIAPTMSQAHRQRAIRLSPTVAESQVKRIPGR